MLTSFERLHLRLKLFFGRITTGKLVVGVLIQQDGKYLLIDERRKDGVFLNIPAGHVEPRETPKEAAIREAKEESGLDVQITGVRSILCSTWKQGRHSVYWVFDAQVLSGNACGENGSEIHWLTREEWEVRMSTMKSMPAIPYMLEAVTKGLSIPLDALYFLNRHKIIQREQI